MDRSDRQRGLCEINCRQERINLTKREERQSNTPNQRLYKGRGRRDISLLRSLTVQCTASSFEKRYGCGDCYTVVASIEQNTAIFTDFKSYFSLKGGLDGHIGVYKQGSWLILAF